MLYFHVNCLFDILGFYTVFNIILVISQQQLTYSWSLGKQTSTRLGNEPCPRVLYRDRRAAAGDWTRDVPKSPRLTFYFNWPCHVVQSVAPGVVNSNPSWTKTLFNVWQKSMCQMSYVFQPWATRLYGRQSVAYKDSCAEYYCQKVREHKRKGTGCCDMT